MNIICCVCAGSHHPWDCDLARRHVAEASSRHVTPHDANARRAERERARLLDEAAAILRPLVSEIDREDREVVRIGCLRGKQRAGNSIPSNPASKVMI